MPAPFGPSSATHSPARTSSSMGASATLRAVATPGAARRDEHAGRRTSSPWFPPEWLPFDGRICSRPASGRLRREPRWATIPPRSRRSRASNEPVSTGVGRRGIGSPRCRGSARGGCGSIPTRAARAIAARCVAAGCSASALRPIVAAITLGLTLSGHDPTPVAADPVARSARCCPPVRRSPQVLAREGSLELFVPIRHRPHHRDRLPPGRRQPLVLARSRRAPGERRTCSTRSGATSSATAAAACATTSPTAAPTRSMSARAPAPTSTPPSTGRSCRSRPT